MSLIIKNAILKIASNISVTIPADNLSTKQKKQLVDFALTGLIVGDGVPAQIARHLRAAHKLGQIRRDKVPAR